MLQRIVIPVIAAIFGTFIYFGYVEVTTALEKSTKKICMAASVEAQETDSNSDTPDQCN